MKILAVMNQKGGVGKTTTAGSMAHELARIGHRVLVMDLDPQGHLTDSFGVKSKSGPGTAEILNGCLGVHDLASQIRDSLFMIKGNRGLMGLEGRVGEGMVSYLKLHHALHDINVTYDYVILDCPPSSGFISLNALFASDEIVMPITGDYLALHGAAGFLNILQRIRQIRKREMKHWIVLTRFQPRRKLAMEVRNKIMEHYPQHVLATVVRENVALAECPGFGLSIFEYAAASTGAADYSALVLDYLHGNTMKTCSANVA